MGKCPTGSLRLALACSAAAGAMISAGQVHAQEDPPQVEDEALITGETIIVTGSRIQRQDYEANSPIVTANEELFENSSTAAIETALNKLPAFTPVQTPALGGNIQPTATSTPGAATISLRNLAPTATWSCSPVSVS